MLAPKSICVGTTLTQQKVINYIFENIGGVELTGVYILQIFHPQDFFKCLGKVFKTKHMCGERKKRGREEKRGEMGIERCAGKQAQ